MDVTEILKECVKEKYWKIHRVKMFSVTDMYSCDFKVSPRFCFNHRYMRSLIYFSFIFAAIKLKISPPL